MAKKKTTCFVTEKPIPVGDLARFTFWFNEWVSEEGQKLVYKAGPNDRILNKIRREWYRCPLEKSA